MLNAQQKMKDNPSMRYRSQKPFEPTSLPKLSYDSSPQKAPNKQLQFQLNPLKRSVSMSQVLHGDGDRKSNHYIDCTLFFYQELDRFKRNHDVKNKQERQLQRQTTMNRLMQRRNFIIKRQEENKKREEENLRSIVEKNAKILSGHQQGLIRSPTYNTSLPVNPITLKYENNALGQWQRQIDNQQRVRKLIRGNRIQQMGTSGYNLINGSPLNNASKILQYNNDIKELYEQKLQKFNENFKIKPQTEQEFQKTSASRIFKYY